jgi:hypothetical protein
LSSHYCTYTEKGEFINFKQLTYSKTYKSVKAFKKSFFLSRKACPLDPKTLRTNPQLCPNETYAGKERYMNNI